jgi:deoxyribodipyrimidine photolyase-related protein
MEYALVFPHQLYNDTSWIDRKATVFLIEDELYFRQHRFHVNKLILHRASMKAYADLLTGRGFHVVYIDARDEKASLDNFFRDLSKRHCKQLAFTDTNDYLLERRLTRFSAKQH